MKKHTPGSWEAYQVGFGYNITPDANNESPWVLAKVYQCNNARANAQLIAAAPDLLKACKLGLEWLDEVCNPKSEIASQEGVSVADTIDSAIAKAEGREP